MSRATRSSGSPPAWWPRERGWEQGTLPQHQADPRPRATVRGSAGCAPPTTTQNQMDHGKRVAGEPGATDPSWTPRQKPPM